MIWFLQLFHSSIIFFANPIHIIVRIDSACDSNNERIFKLCWIKLKREGKKNGNNWLITYNIYDTIEIRVANKQQLPTVIFVYNVHFVVCDVRGAHERIDLVMFSFVFLFLSYLIYYCIERSEFVSRFFLSLVTSSMIYLPVEKLISRSFKRSKPKWH